MQTQCSFHFLLFSLSGCHMPCTYMEYYKTQVRRKYYTLTISKNNLQKKKEPIDFQEVAYMQDPSGEKGYLFGYSTNSIIVKEETLLYPFSSFLAEFGGSLSLFIGISFLTLWDTLLGVIKIAFSLEILK